MPELWTTEMHVDIENIPARAQRVEREGWTGMQLTDTQNRSPETYVALTAAALATQRIGLGLGVTNPVTRHPALAAAAAASVQRLSGGRMTMTIGRGDSAAAHIGGSPVRLNSFRRYVDVLRRYLNHQSVPFADLENLAMSSMPSISTLGLAGEPRGSSLEWLQESDLPVPLEVACSGPKVIGIAAEYADRPMLAVGAMPERISWAVDSLRQQRAHLGTNVDAPIGAYVNVAAHDDPAVARRLIKGVLASTARFSVMHGNVQGPTDDKTAEVLNGIHSVYDMTGHGTAGSAQANRLTDDFITTFGIAGTPDHVRNRLQELTDLGISKFVFFPRGRANDEREAERARTVMANGVLPAFESSGV